MSYEGYLLGGRQSPDIHFRSPLTSLQLIGQEENCPNYRVADSIRTMDSRNTASQGVEQFQIGEGQVQETRDYLDKPSQSGAALPGTGLKEGTPTAGTGQDNPGDIDAYRDVTAEDVNNMSPVEHVSARSPKETPSGPFANPTSPTTAQETQPGKAPQRTGTNTVMYDPGNGKAHEPYELDARTGVARPQGHFTAKENLGLRGQQGGKGVLQKLICSEETFLFMFWVPGR